MVSHSTVPVFKQTPQWLQQLQRLRRFPPKHGDKNQKTLVSDDHPWIDWTRILQRNVQLHLAAHKAATPARQPELIQLKTSWTTRKTQACMYQFTSGQSTPMKSLSLQYRGL